MLSTVPGWGRTNDIKSPISSPSPSFNISVQKIIHKYKLRESLIQFCRPKFIYTFLCKSTSAMHELTTQSMKRLKSTFLLRLRQALHHSYSQSVGSILSILRNGFFYKQTPDLYTCIAVNDVLTVEDTINALRFEAAVKQLTRRSLA